MSGKSTCDVAVIGGGVIGLSCAWRLAQRGAKVHLFERGQVGREASWAAAGMLAAQVEAAVHPPQNESAREAFFDLCLQSRALYPSLAEELLDATGVDIELSLREYSRGDWRTPGILYVGEQSDCAFDELEMQRKANLRVEDAPDFSSRPTRWLPDEGQVNNRKLLNALAGAAEDAAMFADAKDDVTFHENCAVYSIHNGIVQTTQSAWQCKSILLCGGAWSAHLENTPVDCLPQVHPVAGEIIALYPQRPLANIIYSRNVYLVPRRDGRVLIGATMEDAVFEKRTTVKGAMQLLRAACDLVPELENAEIKDHWAGLRPATADGLPILGSTPVENLFVATGHFRNGILLTPITGQLMADCILEGKEPPREFAFERFASGVLAS
jgi:glycine oxidase